MEWIVGLAVIEVMLLTLGILLCTAPQPERDI